MLISSDDVLKRANEIYKDKKRGRYPFDKIGKVEPPDIRSDQVKSICEALVEAMNKELFSPIVVHVSDDGDDYAHP